MTRSFLVFRDDKPQGKSTYLVLSILIWGPTLSYSISCVAYIVQMGYMGSNYYKTLDAYLHIENLNLYHVLRGINVPRAMQLSIQFDARAPLMHKCPKIIDGHMSNPMP